MSSSRTFSSTALRSSILPPNNNLATHPPPHLKTLSSSSISHPRSAIVGLRCVDLSRHVTTQSVDSIKKRVENVAPIATGHKKRRSSLCMSNRDRTDRRGDINTKRD
ncbi:hypothetical protein RYX36_016791 [Vicia faba]